MTNLPVPHEKTLWTLAAATAVAAALAVAGVFVAWNWGLWWHGLGLVFAAAVIWGGAGVIYREVIDP